MHAHFRPVSGADEEAQRIDLPDDPAFSLGRDAANGVVLDHPSVSRVHAHLVRAGAEWHLTDGGSSNGTFVNGKAVLQSRILPGDVVRFGTLELVFEADPEGSPPPALEPSAKAAAAGTAPETSGVLAGLLPVAEMRVKAGLAVWAALAVLMLFCAQIRAMAGAPVALGCLALAFVAYAVSTALFLARSHAWIKRDAPVGDESRVLAAATAAAARGGVPLPKLAIARDDPGINAYTYGLRTTSAAIVVTGGFMAKLQPTDEELTAVLAHEVSHIRFGDFVISSLLRFPMWLMHRTRDLVLLARGLVVHVLRFVAQCGGGWMGVLMVLCLFFLLLYLSLLAAMIGAVLFVASLFLLAFEREREYLADAYSARAMGGPGPLQRALASLQVVESQGQQAASAGSSPAAPDGGVPGGRTPRVDEAIATALTQPPSWTDSLSAGEFFSDHPLTPNRLFYLENPHLRFRGFTNLLEGAARWADRWLGQDQGGSAGMVAVACCTGLAAGLPLGALTVRGRWWLDLALALWVCACAGMLGYRGRKRAWSGRAFCQALILASYLAATAVLVVGTLCGNPWALLFPVVFCLVLAAFAGAGLSVAKLLRTTPAPAANARAPEGDPTPETPEPPPPG